MNDIIRFHVPCDLHYTKLVEDFTKIVSIYLHPKATDDFSTKLCQVMNEVFINIVKHSNTSDENEIVRFQFEIGLKYFSISIYDYGPGFKADNSEPPYPKKTIGKKFKLKDVIDGSVYYTVTGPLSVRFDFEEFPEDQSIDLASIEKLSEDGLGMSIVIKLMDTVSYSYIGNGKFDWKLIKKFD